MSAETVAVEAKAQAAPQGMRKNGMNIVLSSDPADAWLTSYLGKQWHTPRKAFRPTAGLISYEQREKRRLAMAVTKAKEKEMKEEKEAERQVRPTMVT